MLLDLRARTTGIHGKRLPRRHPSLGDVGLWEEHSRWETSDVKGQEIEVFLIHGFTEPKTTTDGTRYDMAWATRP